MNIPYCKSENFCVSHDGRAIAMFLVKKWSDEGKRVSWEETTKCISVSYTESGCLSDFDPEKAIYREAKDET